MLVLLRPIPVRSLLRDFHSFHSDLWPGANCSLVGIGSFARCCFADRCSSHNVSLAVWGGCDSGDSPPDSKAQLLPTRTTIPRTTPHQDHSPLGQLPTRTTTNPQNHSSGPRPVVRWGIILVGIGPYTRRNDDSARMIVVSTWKPTNSLTCPQQRFFFLPFFSSVFKYWQDDDGHWWTRNDKRLWKEIQEDDERVAQVNIQLKKRGWLLKLIGNDRLKLTWNKHWQIKGTKEACGPLQIMTFTYNICCFYAFIIVCPW